MPAAQLGACLGPRCNLCTEVYMASTQPAHAAADVRFRKFGAGSVRRSRVLWVAWCVAPLFGS